MSAWLRARAVGVGLALVTLIATVATGSLLAGPSEPVRRDFGLDVHSLFVEGRVQGLISSVLLTSSPLELVAVLAALVLVVGGFERRLGHGRVLLLWVLTAVAGGLGGTALQAAGLLARGFWTTPPITLAVLHPETPVLGVLFGASAVVGPLWRRRIRLVGGAALIVLLLYSGQPEDLDHLAGAAAGLVVGVVATRRSPRLVFPRSSHHEARTLLASTIAVAAIGPLIAVVQPKGYGLLRPLGRLFRDPLPGAEGVRRRCAALRGPDCIEAERLVHLNSPGAVLLSLLPLVVLLVAALLVLRGRRTGIWVAVGTSALLALFAALYYGLLPILGDRSPGWDLPAEVTLQSVLAVLVPLLLAVGVVFGRRHCPVLPSRRALLVGIAAVAAVVVATAVVYLVLGTLVAGQFRPRAGTLQLLADLPERYVPTGFLRFQRPGVIPVGPVAVALHGWIGAIAWATLLVATVAVGSSAPSASTTRDRSRLLALLKNGSGGSLGWMTTWPGNRVWFSPDGRHAIAYRPGSGVALTLGEPVGEETGAIEAARAFALHCDDLGLVPAFYSVRAEFAARLGEDVTWAQVDVGEDTVIDPAAFSMRGKHWQDVRSSINRADRLGLTAVWTSWSALTLAQRAQVEAIGEEWVADKRLPELGFTLGSVAELMDPEVRLMLAVGPEERIEAVTSWLPTWREGEVSGLTLDFMRRRSGSPNGVVEFLIAAVLGAAQQRGLAFVSLSVAPLSGTPDDGDRLERLLAGLARVLEPAYGFRSLATFKEKFKPTHVGQVLAVPEAVSLPAVAVAVARAYLPELSLPAIRQMLGAFRPEEATDRDTTPAVPGRG